jgi:gliding motility-associated-like protein
MKRIVLCFFLLLIIGLRVNSQYADLGTGSLKDKIWWFDWNNFVIADNASRTFTTNDGLTVTFTFSNVQGPVFQPSIMNTWYGAVLHLLYDFSNTSIKPAFLSSFTTQNSQFTVTVTASRNGQPASFKFIAADAEASATTEITTLTSSGSAWTCVDFFRNSSQTTNPFGGCNTTTATITDTYGGSAGIGQNPVIATDAPASGSLVINCDFNRNGIIGGMGIAFGLFAPIDRGDLPTGFGYANHALTYTGNNQCNYLPPLPSLTQSGNLKLGAIAGDADATESSDDNAIGADEDGISSFPVYANNGSYSVTVNLSNTTGSNAYLSGWFDYNRDGIFENNERVSTIVTNNATTSVLIWTGLPSNLPSVSVTDWAFRFRLSSDANALQTPSGFAPDGEVEDYRVTHLQNTTADFTIPDTVCVNEPVNIINNSVNATTSFWNFCVADINSTPSGVNLGNIGNQFQLPVYIDYALYNGNYYGFVTNNFPGKLTRLDFGNSLLNTPTAVDLGTVGGVIPNAAEQIQLAFNEGRWYAIMVGGNSTTGGSKIIKIDFGPDLTNISPVGTDWGNIGGLNYPAPLHLFNDNGNWYAFSIDLNSSIIRFSFGASFQNPPTAVNFGNVGGVLNRPTGIYIISDNGLWYGFVSNRDNSSITRLNFGNSLLNSPTATNLGNPNNTLNLPRDIYLIKFCNQLVGFVVNEGSNNLVKLNFPDLLSIPSGTSLGNVGNLSFPHSISKVFRIGSDLYSFILNVNNNTITRLHFTGCNNSNIPNYSGPTPPPITYTTPGTYNINLTIDDGLPTQTSICKELVVKECRPTVSGIINNYTEVLDFDPCHNRLTVADASAYNIGDTVLMIQMKGAVIDSTNAASFGTITDYKNAGNYEYNYVKNKTGNIIELKNVLLRQYDIPAGKVQLVRVPYFKTTVITSTLTCLPWDGSKGGVLAFNVLDTLDLQSNIDVSGKGFPGGTNGNNLTNAANCFQTGFSYPITSPLGATKGQSITTISNNIIKGRGAPANGGGGGVDHNSGGGGGGNAGVGGSGGYQYEACGNAPFDNRGMPGKNLIYSNASNKIFMGGGGGSGHANNIEGFQPNGGNGGGIVLIQSGYLINTNGNTITANGTNGAICNPGSSTTTCNEGMGGGGAGGTVLLNIGTYVNNLPITANGGKGSDINDNGTTSKHGPGGGGGGGAIWLSQATVPSNISASFNGGANGLNLFYGNDPWGSSQGSIGQQLYNLQIPITSLPFIANIDSVRAKDSVTGCASFDFKGFGFTSLSPIVDWHWYFGDGNTANTQNASHTYSSSGNFTVKLIGTDINGCKDSITVPVSATVLNHDFTYAINACDPMTVNFGGSGATTTNPYWNFGDGNLVNGVLDPVHTYTNPGNYIVKYSVSSGTCSDTIVKTISIAIIPDNIILTQDTTICVGAVKQLRTASSLNFCWTPVTYLNDPNSPQPVTSTPQDITYYFTSQSAGTNLIVNGDFSLGNTGFTSQYTYTPPLNVPEAEYYIGTNPQAWNVGMSPCTDHTTGGGNMMLVNGAAVDNVVVWSETIAVQPNTNYAFSTWVQSISNVSPARLQFSINGINIGSIFQANNATCLWEQFYTTWNSGTTISAVISIVNKNLIAFGNDFALDDISFAPVFIKRDSVKISVEKPVVTTNNNAVGCEGLQVQLNTTGANTYSWSPPSGLTAANIPNPVATPATSTEYIVTGTTVNGCIAKDTVDITINPKPTIIKSGNVTICKNNSTQLSASGGTIYAWTPAATLNDPTSQAPIASPIANTIYYVTVTDDNTCTNIDSITVSIHPDPVFAINDPVTICKNDKAQLLASGGDIYTWQPDPSLSDPAIANPTVTPAVTTNYMVQVTETTCNNSTTLVTTVNVNQLPDVKASKSNDLDCSNDRSQLNATGATNYTWTPAPSLDNAGISNPVATPITSTQYLVKGTDVLSGCSNYDSVTVEFLALNKSGYFMPNAFTPNQDGLNDCFGIRYWGVIQHLEFSVYNRWGQRIFFTTDPNACWDGTYRGTMQDIGVYVYMIKAKTLCGETFKKGLFTLAR